ncbi:intracellular multiplication protein IcmB [Thalassospira xiamenensis M-5 = DSM 17429]|uniref:IcmB n=1 Tax=Thalassospira xiamenensis M-5 = DSM 17429 TaxID=1123366 RepID=A0AB72UJL4_9PROT|nr:hypothetical protein [Thalassospira xiamenensis]AJD54393.1 icmB [Thalassospira xiamenensis M-5 = DSM 17429]SIT21862.1 intracellular multiplication protein IcmB [Thalassospira xiamenensis M-5 = DSM 17429]
MLSTLTNNWRQLVEFWGSTSLKHFCDLESSASASTLSTYDGSLVSLIVLNGRSQITGGQELNAIVSHLSHTLGGFLQRKHHSIEFFYCSDPDRAQEAVLQQVSFARDAADNIGLDISDILAEREKMLPHDMRYETCAIAIWTRPTALTSSDNKDRKAATNNASPADKRQARVHDTLLAIHEAFVSQFQASLSDNNVNMYCHIASKHEFVRLVRGTVYTEERTDVWNPRLPGDKVDIRASNYRGNLPSLLEDPIDEQIFNRRDNFDIDTSIAQIGSRLYSALDMELPPAHVADFQSLLLSILRSEFSMPFRASFLLTGDGLSFIANKALFASFLVFAGSANKQISASYDAMRERANAGETFVSLQASFATWAPLGEKKLLLTRLERLRASLRSWGNMETTNLSGDPAEAALGSSLALRPSKIGPGAAAPLGDALHMAPLARPATPFPDGTMILRSPDGKPMPIKVGSSEQDAWVYLIYGPMGRGKSVLISTMLLDHILTPQGRKNAPLPLAGIIDIGSSSEGLINLIRDGLPADKQHQAIFVKMQEDENHRINMLDTSLGLRYPLKIQKNLQKNILSIICANSDGKQFEGMRDLISRVLNEAYRMKDDKEGQPTFYSRNIDYSVDDILQKSSISLPSNPTWWDVVDLLFEAGHYHHAKLAQRHAVPTLIEVAAASNSPKIRQEFQNTSVAGTGEPLINAFQRIITSASEEYPALAGKTTFDIGEARVIAIDNEDVVPGNTDTGAAKTGVMMLLARHVIAGDWFLRPTHFDNIPEKYRSYHVAKAEQIMESKRLLLYDEKQRSAGIEFVDEQIDFDTREGRKAGLMLVIASQRHKDFSESLINLSSCQFILGSGAEEREELIKLFKLQGAQKSVLHNSLNGPGPMGAPLLMLAQLKNRPEFRQFLYNKIGPIELWAFNTTMEDRHLRETMSRSVGGQRARSILANRFPKGSAVNLIARMKKDLQAKTANLSSEDASLAAAEILAKQLIKDSELANVS